MRSKKEEADAFVREIQRIAKESPPRIGVVGVSGTGKSSTLNHLFGLSLATSDTVACTKELWDGVVEVDAQGPQGPSKVQLTVVDAPGLGEDLAVDPRYMEMYEAELPTCDVVLWVTAARNRAVALEQIYLERIVKLNENIVFGLSQVDLVQPMDWPADSIIPSAEQITNIKTIVRDRELKFGSVMGRDVSLVPYSSHRRYQLEVLFSKLIEAVPVEKGLLYGSMLSSLSVTELDFEEIRALRMEHTVEPALSGARDEGPPRLHERTGGDTAARQLGRLVGGFFTGRKKGGE